MLGKEFALSEGIKAKFKTWLTRHENNPSDHIIRDQILTQINEQALTYYTLHIRVSSNNRGNLFWSHQATTTTQMLSLNKIRNNAIKFWAGYINNKYKTRQAGVLIID